MPNPADLARQAKQRKEAEAKKPKKPFVPRPLSQRLTSNDALRELRNQMKGKSNG